MSAFDAFFLGIPVAPACDKLDFQLWHVSPVTSNGWAYVGELDKYVPVSGARTRGVRRVGLGIEVLVKGVPNETIRLGFVDTNAVSGTDTAGDLPIVNVECVFSESGTLRVLMPAKTCLNA